MTDGEGDEDLLCYIAESIGLIKQYTRAGEDVFKRTRMVQDAVVRRLETLADAAHDLSQEMKGRRPDLPWKAIYGFRNVAAHGYAGLDLARVWRPLQEFLPALESVVAEELERSSSSGE